MKSATTMAGPASCCVANDSPVCEHWREFGKQMLLAHLRGNLHAEAVGVVERICSMEVGIDANTVALELASAVANARPRSSIVPWHLAEDVVDRMIEIVAADVAAGLEVRVA